MMLKVFLFAPYVALASSFLLGTVVSMICISQAATPPREADGFTLRAKRAAPKFRPRTAPRPASVKRAWQKVAA
jgi:hypothetical protein